MGKSKKQKFESVKDHLVKEDEEKINDCPNCKKGRLNKTDLGPKTLFACSVCYYRILKKSEKNG